MLHPDSRYPHPGKYEGERMLLVLAHSYSLQGMEDDSFGDVSEWPFYHLALVHMGDKYGKVGVATSEQGFVSEVSEADYFRSRESYEQSIAEDEAREEAIQDVTDELAELQGGFPCDQCDVLTINGIPCHEQGCPRDAKVRQLQRQLDKLENY